MSEVPLQNSVMTGAKQPGFRDCMVSNKIHSLDFHNLFARRAMRARPRTLSSLPLSVSLSLSLVGFCPGTLSVLSLILCLTLLGFGLRTLSSLSLDLCLALFPRTLSSLSLVHCFTLYQRTLCSLFLVLCLTLSSRTLSSHSLVLSITLSLVLSLSLSLSLTFAISLSLPGFCPRTVSCGSHRLLELSPHLGEEHLPYRGAVFLMGEA